MNSINDIKTRIRSVTNTKQITKAMELVATSKLRRAIDKAENSRPYHNALFAAIADICTLPETGETVYGEVRENPKTCYIVVGGERGLAGGYNNNIFRFVNTLLDENSVVIPIGKKALEHYQSAGAEILTDSFSQVSAIGVGESLEIGRLVAKLFTEKKIDCVKIVYTKFISILSQQVTCDNLLPLTMPEGTESKEPIFEGDPEEMLDSIVPEYLGGSVYIAVSESFASECAARRTAMNAANKNAEEMIDGLTLSYNRARQAIITQEITEIVAGANG